MLKKSPIMALSLLAVFVLLIVVGCGDDEVTDPVVPTVPVLTTSSISAITQTTAECGGAITSDGGAAVTTRGVCWSTSAAPTIADNKTTDGTGIGSFTSTITGLTAGTTYNVRAYATNSAGAGYGPAQSFTTTAPVATVTDIDGNIYQTVTIGTQVWMAENLKVTHYRNGDAIPHVSNEVSWAGLATGAYCEYDNNLVNVDTYGRLYNWFAVNDIRNIAPAGWHVPTDDDWKQLEMALGMGQTDADLSGGGRGTDEGSKLKEVGTTHWTSNAGATNEFGFTGLPGGYRGSSGVFESQGDYGEFWTTTETAVANYPWNRELRTDSRIGRYDDFIASAGLSVRCVKD